MSGPHTPSTEPAARAGAGSKASSPVPSSPPAAVDNSNDTTTTTTTSITNPSDKASQDADLDAQQASRESSREEGEEDSEEEEGEEPEPPPEAASSQPPLPPEAPPTEAEDNDGWQPIWDDTYQAYYFYNSHTNETTWTNPRVPEATLPTAAAAAIGDPPLPLEDEPDLNLTYNPAIHGDYDPTAPYAQVQNAAGAQGDEYVARGAFNRFTGKFQPATSRRVPENYNDENKSRRQMEFYFDVDAAASTHDGRSLKAERQTRKLSRKEVREFQEKRKARKEEKRKAWLRD